MALMLESSKLIGHRVLCLEAAPNIGLKDVDMRIIKGRKRLSIGLSQVLCDWLLLQVWSLCSGECLGFSCKLVQRLWCDSRATELQ